MHLCTQTPPRTGGATTAKHKMQYGEQGGEKVSQDTHINIMEISAICRMLEHMGSELDGKHVRVYANNITAVACIGKGGSARSKECQAETGSLGNHRE